MEGITRELSRRIETMDEEKLEYQGTINKFRDLVKGLQGYAPQSLYYFMC
jgi:hypothetical protein